MPYLLQDVDSDVELFSPDTGITDPHQRRIAMATPVWAQLIRTTHSSRSSLTETEMASLRLRMTSLSLPVRDDSSTWTDMPSAMQHAMFETFHHRMMIVMHGSLLGSTDQQTRTSAEDIVFHSAMTIIRDRAQLARLIEEEKKDERVRSAWAHFVFAVLHCNFFNATRLGTSIIQKKLFRRSDVDTKMVSTTNNDHVELFNLLDLGDEILLNRVECLSPAALKEYMMLAGKMSGVRDRVQRQIDGNLPRQDLDSDGYTEMAIETMARAMNDSLKRARKNIEKARLSEDPPPALCSDEVLDVPTADMASNGQQIDYGNNNVPIIGGDMASLGGIPTDNLYTGNIPEVRPQFSLVAAFSCTL
jgi:hypothetical protein